MLAAASLGEDAALLDLLVEAAQGAFERLVLSHSDFSQSVFTSSDQGLLPARPGARPTGLDALLDGGRQSRRSLPEGPGRVKRRDHPVGRRCPSTMSQYRSTTAITAHTPMMSVGRRRKHLLHETPRVIDFAYRAIATIATGP